MSQLVEHYAALLLDWIDRSSGQQQFSFTPETAAKTLDGYGLNFGPERMKLALSMLVEIGCAEHIYSPLTNGFYKVSREKIRQRFSFGIWIETDALPELEGSEAKYPVLHASLLGGHNWADHVVGAMQRNPELWRNDTSYLRDVQIPASDRVVRLDHNQAAAILEPTDKLIEQLEADNGVEAFPGFRERILGQIKAAKELIKAQVFDFQIFYMTMIIGLKMLIDKYDDHLIGAAAQKLLDLIIDKVGEFF